MTRCVAVVGVLGCLACGVRDYVVPGGSTTEVADDDDGEEAEESDEESATAATDATDAASTTMLDGTSMGAAMTPPAAEEDTSTEPENDSER